MNRKRWRCGFTAFAFAASMLIQSTWAGWIDTITILHLATQTAGFEKPGGYTKLIFEPDSLIVVIPSLDIVVARAGQSWKRDWAGHYDVLNPFFGPIVTSVKRPASRRNGSAKTAAFTLSRMRVLSIENGLVKNDRKNRVGALRSYIYD